VLAGNNSYGGPTIVSNGILRAGAATAFPSATDITVINGATLDISRPFARRKQPDAPHPAPNSSASGGSLGLGSSGTALSMEGGEFRPIRPGSG
jgi:hypothetical protein